LRHSSTATVSPAAALLMRPVTTSSSRRIEYRFLPFRRADFSLTFMFAFAGCGVGSGSGAGG
jgi:hypothetical protein